MDKNTVGHVTKLGGNIIDDLKAKLAAATAREESANKAAKEWQDSCAEEMARAEQAEAERDKLKSALEYETSQVAVLREQKRMLHDERQGSVWIWQGDGDDYLESLVCPILIRPYQLAAIIEVRDAATTTLQTAREALEPFARLDTKGLERFPGSPSDAYLWKPTSNTSEVDGISVQHILDAKAALATITATECQPTPQEVAAKSADRRRLESMWENRLCREWFNEMQEDERPTTFEQFLSLVDEQVAMDDMEGAK